MNEVYRCPHSSECESKLKEDESTIWLGHIQYSDFWLEKGCPYNYNCRPSLSCIVKIQCDGKPSKEDLRIARAHGRYISKLKHKIKKEDYIPTITEVRTIINTYKED